MAEQFFSVASQAVGHGARMVSAERLLVNVLDVASEFEKSLARFQLGTTGYEPDAERDSVSYYGLRYDLFLKCGALIEEIRALMLGRNKNIGDVDAISMGNLSLEQNSLVKELYRCAEEMQKQYKKPMQRKPVERFRRSLEALRATLAPIKQPDDGKRRCRLVVTLDPPQVILDSQPPALVSLSMAEFLQALIHANGSPVTMSQHGIRSRDRRKLPRPVDALIEPGTGSGCCLKPEVWLASG